jgi:MFS family permease
LTGVRGKTVGVAGLVVTLASVSWSVGSWWQSRVASSWTRARLVVVGGVLVLTGAVGVGACLWPSVPLLVAYVAWTIGGLGMGVAFPTISLVAMESSPPGGQTSAVASTQLTETLGASVGPGIAGSSVALSAALGASLTAGLAGGLVVALVAALVLLPVSARLPSPAGARAEVA